MQELLDALKRDNLVALKKILESGKVSPDTEVIIGEEYDLDEPDEVPLLHYAIQFEVSLDAIEMLVAHGIDITEINRDGLGALDIAIKYKRMDIVNLCEAHGISLMSSRRKSGMTPLMVAASFNDFDMVELLISKGADVNGVDKYGMSATDYVKRMGQKKMLEFLQEHGAIQAGLDTLVSQR